MTEYFILRKPSLFGDFLPQKNSLITVNQLITYVISYELHCFLFCILMTTRSQCNSYEGFLGEKWPKVVRFQGIKD